MPPLLASAQPKMPTAPLLPDFIAKALQVASTPTSTDQGKVQAAVAAGQPAQPQDQGQPQPAQAAAPNNISMVADPNAVEAFKDAQAGQQELERLQQTGSGVHQLKNKFHLPLHGLAVAGDIAGSILAPRIMQAIPGTTLHHQELVNTQQNRIKNDLAAGHTAEEANEAYEQGQAAGNRPLEQADRIQNLNDKLAQQGQQFNQKLSATQAKDKAAETAERTKLTQAYRKMGLDENGQPLSDSALTADELTKRQQEQANVQLTQAKSDYTAAEQALAKARQDALTDPNNPELKVREQAAQTAALNAQSKLKELSYAQIRGIMSGVRESTGILDYMRDRGVITQKEEDEIERDLPMNPVTGQHVPLASPMMPTTATRSRGQQAAEVMPIMDNAEDMIGQISAELGPAAGRWNQFITGRMGVDNPQFQKFQTAMTLIEGAYTKLHLNSIIGFDHFKKLMMASQSPQNLIATIEMMKELGEQYEAEGQGHINGPHPYTSTSPFGGLDGKPATKGGGKQQTDPFAGLKGGIPAKKG